MGAPSTLPRVALLIETTRTYTREILQGVRHYIDVHSPWSCFVALRALDSAPPDWLQSWDGDGILTRTHTQEMAGLIAGLGVPAVELRSTDLDHAFPFVGMDNRLIGRSVAEHFLTRGYHRFAIYSTGIESFFRERNQNFRAAVTAAGCPCDLLSSDDESASRGWEEEQQRLTDWLRQLPKPVGLFATTDSLAVKVLDACGRAGIRVPQEIAVVGTENDETLCNFAEPTLTSIAFDGATVGMRAAGLLDRMMQGDDPPDGPVLVAPKGIVRRQSSDELLLDDKLVASALKMIRDEACDGIGVGTICQRLNTSRSTLERRMKVAIGRTPKSEILRLRFRRVEDLLRSSNLTVEAIAERAGFRHASYLQASFRERYGTTPDRYRKSFA